MSRATAFERFKSDRPVILWGGKGQAKVLRDLLSHNGQEVKAVFDNDPQLSPPFKDVPLFIGAEGFSEWFRRTGPQPGAYGCLVAIGGQRGLDRHSIQQDLTNKGLVPEIAVHFSATVGGKVKLGAGTQILAGSIIGTEADIGEACIVNSGAIIDHESILEDGVHVAPGAHLAGEIRVCSYAFIGIGAVILPGIKIGCHAVVGGGAVVVEDVMDYQVVAGNPARVIKLNQNLGDTV